MKAIAHISHDDVADFFLAFANESGELLTNLKLQKLVFYAQAWHLANYGRPLFDEEFQAWVHGPVLPLLYAKYKENGYRPILRDVKIEDVEKKFTEEVVSYLNDVAQAYMRYNAYELELMTHNEDPWREARGDLEPDARCEVVISKESMARFYGEKVKINNK